MSTSTLPTGPSPSEQEQRWLHALLENGAVGILIVDQQGHIEIVNRKIGEMFGYERAALVGQQMEILLPSALRDIHHEHRRGYFATPRARPMGVGLNLAGRRSDGSEFPVEIGLSYIETARGVLGIAFVTDITERKRMEEAMERHATEVEQRVAEERSRLARDLHDAVTQTLFSASLIAEVLPRLWERKPEEGERRLHELRELTRGALAEMRTLLYELRPNVLVNTELGDLLRQLAEATTGRARLPIHVHTAPPNPPLPADAQVALYRIAQEALNNIAKHAAASSAEVALRVVPTQQVSLHISDDGRGFDAAQVGAEQLGLEIMRERAAAIGATLQIESTPGSGTTIHATWHYPQVEQ